MQPAPHRYFIINKPVNMVSQFVSTHQVGLLGNLDFDFPEGTHAVGRLDSDSEGLLILTTNKKVTRLLFQGDQPHKRTYLVLVNNQVTSYNLERLRAGVEFKIQGGISYKTAPCEVNIVTNPEIHFESPFPLSPRVTYTWLRISLTEGKFHQVRKMIAAINHRVKRLVRVSIEDLQLGDLPPGGVRELEEAAFFRLLKITDY
ncbi:MAG: rRNA pseudouridine synthase [Sediminibacterium sp.]|nr:rRNA pseudouridine synthase [Sediminibacterium sp.]